MISSREVYSNGVEQLDIVDEDDSDIDVDEEDDMREFAQRVSAIEDNSHRQQQQQQRRSEEGPASTSGRERVLVNNGSRDNRSTRSGGNNNTNNSKPQSRRGPLNAVQRAREAEAQAQAQSSKSGLSPGRGQTATATAAERSSTRNADHHQQQDTERSGGDPSLAFRKGPRMPGFEPYTLEDYQRMRGPGYYELGKLGPDLDVDALAEKKAKIDKAKSYAQEARANNISTTNGVDGSRQGKRVEKSADKPSTRKKALEFANNIPKPKVPVKQSLLEPQQQEQYRQLTELEALELQHQLDQERVEVSVGVRITE
eukprot:jgi/Chlat1/2325/Chrsp17S02606